MLEGIGKGASPLILWIRIGSDVRSSWSWLSFEGLFVCNRGKSGEGGGCGERKEGVCWRVSAEDKVLLLSLSSERIGEFVGYSSQNESTGVCKNKKRSSFVQDTQSGRR